MKCFIHTETEAIAACRKCGKGMCEDCSSYSGHSGICPECRREDFIKECNQKYSEIAELTRKIKWNIFWMVVLAILFVFFTVMAFISGFEILIFSAIILIIFLAKLASLSTKKRNRATLLARADKLSAEIKRLGIALKNKHGKIFE